MKTLKHFESIAFQEILRDLHDQLQLYSSIINSHSLNGNLNLQNQVSFLLKTIKETKSELKDKNTFTSLIQLTKEEAQRQSELYLLQDNLKDKKGRVKELEKLVEQLNEFRGIHTEKLCRLNDLKDQVELEKERGAQDEKFVEAWLSSRNDYEGNVKHRDEIALKKKEMQDMKLQMERDCTAYENVVAWTNLKSIELDKDMEEEKDRFTKALDIMKENIQEKRTLVAEQEEKIVELDQLIRKQVQELIPWEEEKEQERLERLQHMRRYYSCRKLQRWWRKLMVQHGLYRKKKQKTKGNKAPAGNKTKGKAKSTKKPNN